MVLKFKSIMADFWQLVKFVLIGAIVLIAYMVGSKIVMKLTTK